MATAEGIMSRDAAAPGKEGIYLISRSREGCLAVMTGSTPQDAVVVVARPDGSEEQQWYDCDGQWQWGGDRSLCLAPAPEGGAVGLAECSSSPARWLLDAEGRMTIDSRALAVPKRFNEPVVLKHISESDREKWWTDAQLKASLKGVKPAVYPIAADDTTTYEQEIARGILNRIAPLNEPLPYPRDVARFPGAVDDATPRVRKTITLDLSVLGQPSNLRMLKPRDWQATDLYVAAGDVVQVDLPETLSPQRAGQIGILVGAHTDRLYPHSGTVRRHKHFWRMPTITEAFRVKPGQNHLRSQYGGKLIFTFKNGENFKVDAVVSNVVEAPYFRLGKTTPDEWDNLKKLDAPQALFESNRVVLVVKSKVVHELPFPDQLMQRYEQVIDSHNDLAGFTEDDPPPRAKFWLVNDIQISAGSAHAGFPVMVGPCRNLASLHSPYCWCIWHELGHDYQQAHYWSYAYGSETTVNLFSLHDEERFFHKDKLKDNGLYRKTASKVDEGMTFGHANCWQKLVFLMEIKYYFPDVGWDMYRQLNRTTRALPEEEAHHLAHNHQSQIDYLYKNLSKSVSHDLILTNDRWGIKISQEAQQEIQSLGLPKAPADLSIRD